MNNIEYFIKDIDLIPTVFGKVILNEEVITEYQIVIPQDISKLEINFIEEYLSSLENKFDQFISEIKNDKDSYNKFSFLISSITEVLRLKLACTSYIERMDIIE
jgi:hypothetical protein